MVTIAPVAHQVLQLLVDSSWERISQNIIAFVLSVVHRDERARVVSVSDVLFN